MNDIQCTHCGSVHHVRNGSYKGVQRYRCKDCGRFFSDTVRKFTYRDKMRFLQMYLNNVGVNKAAQFMGCSPALIVRWIREFAETVRRQLSRAQEGLGETVPDIIEMDEIYTMVKKGGTGLPYGLLILGDSVRLLRFASGQGREKP